MFARKTDEEVEGGKVEKIHESKLEVQFFSFTTFYYMVFEIKLIIIMTSSSSGGGGGGGSSGSRSSNRNSSIIIISIIIIVIVVVVIIIIIIIIIIIVVIIRSISSSIVSAIYNAATCQCVILHCVAFCCNCIYIVLISVVSRVVDTWNYLQGILLRFPSA